MTRDRDPGPASRDPERFGRLLFVECSFLWSTPFFAASKGESIPQKARRFGVRKDTPEKMDLLRCRLAGMPRLWRHVCLGYLPVRLRQGLLRKAPASDPSHFVSHNRNGCTGLQASAQFASRQTHEARMRGQKLACSK